MKISKVFLIGGYLLLILIVFSSIFSFLPISGGDYTFLSPSIIAYWRQFAFSLWDPKINLGWSIVPLLSSGPYIELFGSAGILLHDNTILLERLFWWFPVLIIATISPIILTQKLFEKSFFSFLAPLVFLLIHIYFS